MAVVIFSMKTGKFRLTSFIGIKLMREIWLQGAAPAAIGVTNAPDVFARWHLANGYNRGGVLV